MTEYKRGFLLYPKDVPMFVQYCERFQVAHNMEMHYIPSTKDDDGGDKFRATVILYSELDTLRFINCFTLFFANGKPIWEW